MPSVNFLRPEVRDMRDSYQRIADAITGEEAIKKRGARYLPAPEDTSNEKGRQRYHDYKTRAVFYNVTKRTQQGLVGQVFNREPTIELPASLAFTEGNMDGVGINAMQQAKKAVGHVVAFGRAGLLSDFPTAADGQEFTAEDLQTGRVAPSITLYECTQIINWRYAPDAGRKKLLFVILEENRDVYKPGDYSFTRGKQWRVCRLDESGLYVQELYTDKSSTPERTSTPRDYNGNRLDYIPFEFVGSEDNDPDMDDPPMYSLASLNIAHYRNSADFEDSTFLVGQPTIVVTGLDQNWLDTALKGEKLRFGSRYMIPLPTGAKMEIVQAEPNNLAKEGMDHKERQMVALGAKLVEERQVQRTATEAAHEEGAEASVLQTSADNTSVAYAQAFATCARFISGNDPQINYRINTAFEIQTMDANSRAETIKEWQMGALTFEEMRQVLRRCGMATLPDDVAKQKILEEERQRALVEAAVNPDNPNPGNGNNQQDE